MFRDDKEDLYLPTLREGIRWDDLNLPPSIHRIITSAVDRPEELNNLSLRQLLGIPQMRRQHVFGLLFAIQECASRKPHESQPEPQITQNEDSVVSFEELNLAMIRNRLDDIRAKRIPAPPSGTVFSDSRFGERTRRIFRLAYSAGLIHHPADIAQLRVEQLLGLRGVRIGDIGELVRRIEKMVASRRKSEDIARACQQICADTYAESVRSDDVRFGSYVRCIAADAANAREAAISVLNQAGAILPLHVVSLRNELDKAACLKLEEELASILYGCIGNERGRSILVRRLGWGGTAPKLGRVVAQELNCNVQSVSDWRSVLQGKLKGSKPFAPILDRVLDTIKSDLPCPAEKAQDRLLSAGLTHCRFDPRGIENAARILGRTPTFLCKQRDTGLFLSTVHTGQEYTRTVRLARRIVRRNGFCLVGELVREVHPETPENLLIAELAQEPGFAWLDESTASFWFIDHPDENPIVKAIRKIQAISRTVQVSDLRVAFKKKSGLAATLSDSMLMRLCAQIPGLKAENDVIIAQSPPPDRVLTRAERVVADIMLEIRGPAMPAELYRRCLPRGIPYASVRSVLFASPILLRVGPGRYKLAGSADR